MDVAFAGLHGQAVAAAAVLLLLEQRTQCNALEKHLQHCRLLAWLPAAVDVSLLDRALAAACLTG